MKDLTDAEIKKWLTEEEREIYDAANEKWASSNFDVSVCAANIISAYDILASTRVLSEERRAMLEKHRWRKITSRSGNFYYACPECEQEEEDGHAENCKYKRLL